MSLNLKKKLCRTFSVALESKYQIDKENREIVKAASALKAHRDKMPEEAQAMKIKFLAKCLDIAPEEVTEDVIIECAERDYKVPNPNANDEAEEIVRCLETLGQYQWLVETFRGHFVKTLKPKYLPIGWCVDKPVISPHDIKANKFIRTKF